jgi:hypothetical protein
MMAKKKPKKAKQANKKPKPVLTIDEIIAKIPSDQRPNPRLPAIAKKLDLVSTGISILVFAFAFYEFRYNREIILHNLKVLPSDVAPILIISFASLWGIITAMRAFQIGFQANVHFLFEPEFVSKGRILISAANIFSMIMSAAALLYLLGFISLILTYFENQIFPSLSAFTNMVLANITGWILSGVIGNFVYDMLKRIFTRKEKDINIEKGMSQNQKGNS